MASANESTKYTNFSNVAVGTTSGGGGFKLAGVAVTSTAAELNQLDGNILSDMTPGTGISTGTGTICEHSVTKVGGLFKTEILIDLTGLNSGGGVLDVIGKDGGTANCHIGQITAAVNGTIIAATMAGHQAPAGGDPDINVYTSTDGTIAQDTPISAAAGQALMVNAGDMTASSVVNFTAWPAADSYLYLVSGAVTDADYTAGVFVITLWGI